MATERYIAVPAVPVIITLAKRELVRFFRQRNRVIGALIQPILFWGLFSAGLKNNDLGFAFFFPGTIAMILLFTAIFTTISIIEDRREGFLQSILVSPVPRWSMVLGKIIGGAIIAIIQALLECQEALLN
jgi:ABC-2 type transport system permease protein